MPNVYQKLKHVLITYEIELVEIMSGFAALCWGIWLINPLLNTFITSDTFDTMAMIAPEWLWGLSMVTIGFAQVESVISHKLARRKISSLILSVMWMFITTIFLYSNIASTAGIIYGTFAFFTAWSYLRLSQRVEIKSKFSKH